MKIITCILARCDSKGIKLKNIYPLNNKPLISYSIEESLKSNTQETYVSTDCFDIEKVSKYYGAKVFRRNWEYAQDHSSSESALLEFTENQEFDVLIFIQPTSPLIKYEYINKGINMILNEGYDSIFSCYKQHFIPEWSFNLKPLNWGNKFKYWITGKPEQYPRRQDKQSKLLDIGMFYVIKKEVLLKNKFRLGGKIGTVEIPLIDSFQVDTIEDLKLIEKLMK